MIWIFSDHLSAAGGIETYLHALCVHLKATDIPFRVAVCEMERCPVIDELHARGIRVYRQRRIPGDRWSLRQHVLCNWLFPRLRSGDWVFCVRQPREEIYERLIRGVHRRGARLAASWAFTPDALPVKAGWRESFNRAVSLTDAVISVSRRGAEMYREIYNYHGSVHVVPYHNLTRFPEPLELPPSPPWKFGFMGRIEETQKNLKALLDGFSIVAGARGDVSLSLHGGGPDLESLRSHSRELACSGLIRFFGPYDSRKDLPEILGSLHCVIYTSRFEGGPCFSLLEAMQAGRFAIASAVGGIPDLYADHPEAGRLITEPTGRSIADAIEEVARMLDQGAIQTSGPRMVYDGGFRIELAHQAWLKALELDEQPQSSVPAPPDARTRIMQAPPETDPLNGRILPPDGLLARLFHYADRYGYLHALCAYLGRKFPSLWSWLGPIATRRYLAAWMARQGVRIVNLGGGNLLHERWLTADVDPRSDVYVDIRRPLPFQTDSIDVIYLEEVIEHIPRAEGVSLLRECYRAIKPGGWIRLTTPSLNYFAREFLSNPGETCPINEIFRLHGHEHIYSEEELRNLLESSGFHPVLRSGYRAESSHFGSFDSHPERFSFAPPEWSQYWEAGK